jgi:hypothetical protein
MTWNCSLDTCRETVQAIHDADLLAYRVLAALILLGQLLQVLLEGAIERAMVFLDRLEALLPVLLPLLAQQLLRRESRIEALVELPHDHLHEREVRADERDERRDEVRELDVESACASAKYTAAAIASTMRPTTITMAPSASGPKTS